MTPENFSTPLTEAAKYGKSNNIRRLIDSGADVNLVDDLTWSALMVATWNGHFDIVRMLIDAGADPNLVNRSEWTALMYAAGAGRKRNDAVRMLVEAKANLNLVNKQNCSALMLAAKFGHTDTVRMLVDAGADFNLVDEYNCSALMLAASRGCTETVRTLIEAGANVNTRDDKGETALRKASEINSHEIVEVLLQHGARVDSASLGVAQSEDVRSVLQLYHSSQQFHDKTTAMLTEASAGSPTSSDQVLDLVPFITSVYDLRLLLTLNSMVDPPNEGKQADQQTTKLLNAAFGHILSQKLVLDDDACVYFRLVLEYCAESRLLSPSQFMKWKVQATKVNVESAEWVVELEKQVYENSYRLEIHEQAIGVVLQGIHDVRQRLTQCESNIQLVASHLQIFQNGYMQHLEQEERLRYIKATCGLLASVVGFAFAPLLKTVFDSLIDLANPIEIFNHAYQETDIVSFLADKSYEELLKPEVKRQLEKYVIPTIEFETLLRQGIIVTKPELANECQRRGLTLWCADEAKALVPSKLADDSAEIKKDFNGPVIPGKLGDSYNSVDPNEWTVKRSSTAAPRKSTDGVVTTPKPPEETGQQVDNNGKTHTLSDGEVVTFVEDSEALPYHLAVMASHGDLNEFQDLSDVIDDDLDCVDAVTEMRRIKQQIQNVTVNAAKYAQLLGYSELASFISSQMGISAPPPTKKQISVTLLDDIQTCPFFVAVQESEGDVGEFKQWLEVLECEDDQIATKVCATINREEVVDVKKWSPVELACHLGYVDIVKHLLLKKRAKTGERNIVVMIRAKDRAKTLAA